MFLNYNLYSILWLIFIAIITLTPGNALPVSGKFDIPFADKIVHFAVFFVLEYLIIWGFKKQFEFKILKDNAIFFSLLFAFSFGIIIEVLQNYIPLRSFDWWDICADFSGAALGLIIFLFVYRKNKLAFNKNT